MFPRIFIFCELEGKQCRAKQKTELNDLRKINCLRKSEVSVERISVCNVTENLAENSIHCPALQFNLSERSIRITEKISSPHRGVKSQNDIIHDKTESTLIIIYCCTAKFFCNFCYFRFASLSKRKFTVKGMNLLMEVVVVVLLFYTHDKHLWPCRDGQLT